MRRAGDVPALAGRRRHSLPRHPFDPDAAPTAAGMPLLIGTNLDEAALFFAADKAPQARGERAAPARLDADARPRTEHVIAAYKQTRPEATPWDLFIAVASEPTASLSIRLAERKAAGDTAPVYMYLFTWQSDFMGGLFKAAHALESRSCSTTPRSRRSPAPRRQPAARRVDQRSVDRVRERGDPNHAALPAWTPYSAEQRNTMIFDVPRRTERLRARRTRRLARGRSAPVNKVNLAEKLALIRPLEPEAGRRAERPARAAGEGPGRVRLAQPRGRGRALPGAARPARDPLPRPRGGGRRRRVLIVPRGVEHNPVAAEEVSVLLLEPASTLNTGDVRGRARGGGARAGLA